MYKTVTCPQCKYKVDYRMSAFKERGISCCFCKIVLLSADDVKEVIRLENLMAGKSTKRIRRETQTRTTTDSD